MLFEATRLDAKEQEVLKKIEDLKSQLGYALQTPRRWYGLLRRISLAKAVRGSNSIEGYHVSKDDAVAAVVGEEPLDAARETWDAVVGYQRAMTYVLQLADDPYVRYSTDLLRSLHFMMLEHDIEKSPGQWRPGFIQVVDEERGQPVYEAPDAAQVPALMEELVVALNQPTTHEPPMIRAAMAHLNLTMIHPFRDGNGRMARCLQTLVLVREGTTASQFCSIEEYLGHRQNTRAYYDVLAEVGRGRWSPSRDTRPWIRFCLTAHYRQAMTVLRRTKEMSRIWERLEATVKQRGLPERMILALTDAALGYRIRNPRYRSVAEVSDQVASRDLKKLVDAGLLVAQGAARGRCYTASDVIKQIREECREAKILDDPFAV